MSYEVIKEVCRHYGIEFDRCEIIYSGSSNSNYLLGSDKKQYILKCMPKEVYSDNFVAFHNWLSETLKKMI